MVCIDLEKCRGCGLCARDCPVGSIKIVEKKARVDEKCVQCGICIRVCSFQAISRSAQEAQSIKCRSCPVQCEIREGSTGACQRYVNTNGTLMRNRGLVIDTFCNEETEPAILKPLITAVGSGTNYPCSRPAPHIVKDNIEGIDVVTVVTEAPLSYSGVLVKIDTNFWIGEEGAKVRRNGRIVGLVDTEHYGSKMLSIGGANLLTGKDGFIVARTIVELANGERVSLSVEGGAKIDVQMGQRPVINGIEDTKMRVGCGSATIGLFARDMKGVVDEAIILDHHVVGLFSEHLAGEDVGAKWSGVVPNARKSTRGRYFGEHGHGMGGTDIENPRDAIKSIDMTRAVPGMKILVTETTGQKYSLFEILSDGDVKEIQLTPEVKELVEKIQNNCEESSVSMVYFGGVGGSARGGVVNKPLALTSAVHNNKAKLTVGGAPVYILPGGGINFLVDAAKVVPQGFTWVPTPATVAPVEYTMKLADYCEIGGHMDAVKSLDELKKSLK